MSLDKTQGKHLGDQAPESPPHPKFETPSTPASPKTSPQRPKPSRPPPPTPSGPDDNNSQKPLPPKPDGAFPATQCGIHPAPRPVLPKKTSNQNKGRQTSECWTLAQQKPWPHTSAKSPSGPKTPKTAVAPSATPKRARAHFQYRGPTKPSARRASPPGQTNPTFVTKAPHPSNAPTGSCP